VSLYVAAGLHAAKMQTGELAKEIAETPDWLKD